MLFFIRLVLKYMEIIIASIKSNKSQILPKYYITMYTGCFLSDVNFLLKM